MLKYFVAGLFTGLLMAAIAWGISYTMEPQKVAEATLIRNVLEKQVVAWNQGGLAEFMAGYWNSKDLTFYSGNEKQQGWDETLDGYKKRYQSDGKEMGRLTFSDLDIQVISAEHAVVKGRWQVEIKKEKIEGLFTLIMRKTEKGWKIVHDHTSRAIPRVPE